MLIVPWLYRLSQCAVVVVVVVVVVVCMIRGSRIAQKNKMKNEARDPKSADFGSLCIAYWRGAPRS